MCCGSCAVLCCALLRLAVLCCILLYSAVLCAVLCSAVLSYLLSLLSLFLLWPGLVLGRLLPFFFCNPYPLLIYVRIRSSVVCAACDALFMFRCLSRGGDGLLVVLMTCCLSSFWGLAAAVPSPGGAVRATSAAKHRVWDATAAGALTLPLKGVRMSSLGTRTRYI